MKQAQRVEQQVRGGFRMGPSVDMHRQRRIPTQGPSATEPGGGQTGGTKGSKAKCTSSYIAEKPAAVKTHYLVHPCSML